jgi:hypothetical protein
MGSVAAYGTRLAWSHYDQPSGRYWLMTSVAGVTSRVPVGSRGSPFDVGLGPDDHGHAVAVFSRCQRERVSSDALPFSHDAGCVLNAYDFVTGAQWRIAGASSPRRSPGQPTVWGNRVAFAQDDQPGHPARIGVYIAPLRGHGRATRIHGGSTHYRDAGDLSIQVGLPRPRHGRYPALYYSPVGIALHGDRIAFAWTMDLDTTDNLGVTQMWSGNVRGKVHNIESLTTTDNTARTDYNPSFVGGHLYFNYVDFSAAGDGGILTDYNLATRRARYSVDGYSDDSEEAPAFLWIAASSFGLLIDQTRGGSTSPGSCASYGQSGPVTPLTGLCQILVKSPTSLSWHAIKLRRLIGDPYL